LRFEPLQDAVTLRVRYSRRYVARIHHAGSEIFVMIGGVGGCRIARHATIPDCREIVVVMPYSTNPFSAGGYTVNIVKAVGLLIALIFTGSPAFSAQDSSCCGTTMVATREFQRVKTLAGKWRGTATTVGKETTTHPATIEYEVTAGGTALLERLFPGTPHAMVSVYHDKDSCLRMTHYCMLGNQPEMLLTHSDEHSLEFLLTGDCDIDSTTEPHMHSLKITWADADTITQTWTLFVGGQAAMTTTIDLTREP
jgi:hypothetical protein